MCALVLVYMQKNYHHFQFSSSFKNKQPPQKHMSSSVPDTDTATTAAPTTTTTATHRHKKRHTPNSDAAVDSSTDAPHKKRKRQHTDSGGDSANGDASSSGSDQVAFPNSLVPSAAAWQLVPERMVEVIEEMHVYEDFIWRYFSKRETECRLAVLGKLNALLHHKYHTPREQGGCFVFTTEMFDYYDFVASEACTDTNKQDFLFFCGLAICPEFYQWIEHLHYRPESSYNAAAHTSPLRAHPLSNTAAAIAALPPPPAKILNISKAAVLAPTTPRTEKYINTHHCRIGNVTCFARFVEHVFVVIRSFSRGRVSQTFNVQPEIDAVVRMLRADYVVQCSLPHPNADELVIWTRRMRELVRERI
jgi:hypothetical protein